MSFANLSILNKKMFSHNYFIEPVEEILTDLHPKYYVKCIGRVGPNLFFPNCLVHIQFINSSNPTCQVHFIQWSAPMHQQLSIIKYFTCCPKAWNLFLPGPIFGLRHQDCSLQSWKLLRLMQTGACIIQHWPNFLSGLAWNLLVTGEIPCKVTIEDG